MNYPMFSNNNPMYMQNLQSLQDMRDRIDSQMKQMQQFNQNQMQQQVPQPQPQIHQSFQLAPQSSFSEIQAKYVTDINDVKNTFVLSTGFFVNKEMNTLWLKNVNGDIRVFALNEIIEQDPKDLEIQKLRNELEKMKEVLSNESNVNNTIIDESNESKTTNRVQSSKRTNAK